MHTVENRGGKVSPKAKGRALARWRRRRPEQRRRLNGREECSGDEARGREVARVMPQEGTTGHGGLGLAWIE